MLSTKKTHTHTRAECGEEESERGRETKHGERVKNKNYKSCMYGVCGSFIYGNA